MKLFEPASIGKLKLKNRIIMAAMGTGLIEPDGTLSQRAIDYYVARARGGIGLIITTAAHPRMIEQLPLAPFVDYLAVDNKMHVGRLNDLAEAVHDYGAKLALQVTAGRGHVAHMELLRSGGAVGPSPLPAFFDPSIKIRELSTAEVERLVLGFKTTARIAQDAEVDAFEINAHAGYLCDEFMTAMWNKRTDKYGGDLDGRLRFILELIENLRKGAPDIPVIVKYPLTHYLEGARDVEEGLEVARKLEAAGVDALEIDGGCYETRFMFKPTTYSPPGCFAELAAMAKQVVSIPVIAGGKLGDPDLAEKILREGKADFIALARPLLADPDWANKVKEGRPEDIRPCLGDFDGCNGRTGLGKSISCTVNPACGMEAAFTLKPAEKKKSVLVVGGGPGGMEAAMVAALRGHKVTLCEQKDALGGNLIPATVPDFKSDYVRLVDYLSTQMKKLGVQVKLETKVTPKTVRAMKPDAVFVATGGTSIIPEIAAAQKGGTVTAIDLLLGREKAGKSVIVVGGGSIGCEAALYLAKQGKKLTVVEMLDSVLRDMWVANRLHLLSLLADSNVKILTGTKVLKIAGKGVNIVKKDGSKSTLKADTIALAVGLKPSDELFVALRDKVPELYAIGDCVKPRNVLSAIREGFRLARLV